MDFSEMDVYAIAHEKRGDGVTYLTLFLKEYKQLFNEAVNPGCMKCLANYLDRYKKHSKMKEGNINNSGYRLKAMYENIPLEFGSPILVNNDNLTDEYAEILLKRKNGATLFDRLPETKPAKAKRKRVKKQQTPPAAQTAEEKGIE